MAVDDVVAAHSDVIHTVDLINVFVGSGLFVLFGWFLNVLVNNQATVYRGLTSDNFTCCLT